MALVPARPFHTYDLEVEPINWQMPHDRAKRLVRYLEGRLKRHIDYMAKKKKPYLEQCEAARTLLQEILDGLRSDDRVQLPLPVKLHIQGSFGEKPNFHEVDIEYGMQ